MRSWSCNHYQPSQAASVTALEDHATLFVSSAVSSQLSPPAQRENQRKSELQLTFVSAEKQIEVQEAPRTQRFQAHHQRDCLLSLSAWKLLRIGSLELVIPQMKMD